MLFLGQLNAKQIFILSLLSKSTQTHLHKVAGRSEKSSLSLSQLEKLYELMRIKILEH